MEEARARHRAAFASEPPPALSDEQRRAVRHLKEPAS